MPKGDKLDVRRAEARGGDDEESRSLLSHGFPDDSEPVEHHPEPSSPSEQPQQPPVSQLQSSISLQYLNGQPRTPRTPNRVRFDLGDGVEEAPSRNSQADDSWMDEEDYLDGNTSQPERSSNGGFAPLLTGIEAPSVTLATSGDAEFIPENYLESASPKSGLKSAFMNMANSIIGAGIIGQPYAFRQAGMVLGIVLLVLLTGIVDWTIRLIVINAKLSGADSFQTTVEVCFGRSGLIAISIAQWAFAFGGMIAFCVVVGDTIPHVLDSLFPSLRDIPFLWLLTDRRAVIILFILGVSYPLSLYRDISKLAKASTFAVISMLVIVATVVIEGVQVDPDLRGELRGYIFVNTGLVQAIGVISFAFVCHHNSLLIYGSLRKPTLDRFALVTHYSTGISMVLCLVMASAGFVTFGSKTQGNVLNNFPTDNIVVNIARLCFGLNMLATLPLEVFVCRSVMTTFYFPDEPHNPNRHLIFTTSLVVASVIMALITCDLGTVLELIGATSAAALAYILPPLCFIKLSKQGWKSKIPAALCVVFGIAIMGVSVVQAVIKMIKHEGGVSTC